MEFSASEMFPILIAFDVEIFSLFSQDWFPFWIRTLGGTMNSIF